MRTQITISLVSLATVTLLLNISSLVKYPQLNMREWYESSEPPADDESDPVKLLRQRYLDPPSALPYNLSSTNESQGTHMFTWPWIRNRMNLLFEGQRNGFFIEAGALDGQYLSNTLWLERKLNWTGLLIEADRFSYSTLRERHRKAWSSNTCISPENYPKKTVFVTITAKFPASVSAWAFRGHSYEFRKDVTQTGITKYEEQRNNTVQCFPLYTYLEALNVTQVDLLSLDVQGSEDKIIMTILRQKKINIRVIVAEDEMNKFNSHFVTEILNSGYIFFDANIDWIFVKADDPILEKEEVKYFLDTGEIKKKIDFSKDDD